ncbi:MAG: trypsin-like peptidase domain-containing protein [Fimbriimonadales bacterium]
MKLPRPILIIALVFLLAEAIFPFTSQNRKKPTAAKKVSRRISPDRALSAKEIFATARPAMFQVKTTFHEDGDPMTSTGSGFAYRYPDAVATAYHVIAGAETIDVIDSKGVHYSVDAVAFDVDSDVALLGLPKRKAGRFLSGKLYANVATGETAYAIGNPLGLFPDTITQGIVSGKRKMEGQPILQMTASISEGNSGGPLLDDRGRVIGIVDATLTEGQNNNLAVATNQLEKLLTDKDKVQDAASFFEFNKRVGTPIQITPNAMVRPAALFDAPPLPDFLTDIAVGPDGRYAAECTGDTLSIVSIADKKVAQTQRFDKNISALAFRSGSQLAIFFVDGSVETRDCENWEIKGRLRCPDRIDAPKLTAGGDQAVYSVAPDEKSAGDTHRWTLKAIDLTSGEVHVVSRDFGEASVFAVSPNGQTIVGQTIERSGGKRYSRMVKLSLADNAQVKLDEVVDKADAENIAFDAPVFSADGTTIAFAVRQSDGQTVHVKTFDTALGVEKRSYSLSTLFVDSLRFDADGRRLLAIGDEFTGLLNLESGQLEFSIYHGMMALCNSLGASSTNDTIAVANGATLKLYGLVRDTSYLGAWDVTGAIDGTAEFIDGGHAVINLVPRAGGPFGKAVLKINWSDEGFRVRYTVSDVSLVGLSAELRAREKEITDAIRKAAQVGTYAEESSIWISKDSFQWKAADGAVSVFQRKSPESARAATGG